MNTIDTEEVQLKPGFWGRFASRRKTERDEAIQLLKAVSDVLIMHNEIVREEGHKKSAELTDTLIQKTESFLKRFQ